MQTIQIRSIQQRPRLGVQEGRHKPTGSEAEWKTLPKKSCGFKGQKFTAQFPAKMHSAGKQ